MNMRGQLTKHLNGFSAVANVPKFKNTPIIIGEADPDGSAARSASKSPERGYRNVPAYGSYVAAMMKYSLDLAEREGVNLQGVLTWAFMFDGQRWFDGFRTLATNGIHKPVLNAFKMLGQMKGSTIPLTSDGAIPVDEILKKSVRQRSDINGMAVADGQILKIMLWNYHDILVPARPASVQLKVQLPTDYFSNKSIAAVRVTHYRIDETHSNAYTKWLELGSPQNPTPTMIAKMKEAMQLQMLEPVRIMEVNDNELSLNFELPRSGLSLIIIQNPEAQKKLRKEN
jgi:xylan 1,4-beta-xylosidase